MQQNITAVRQLKAARIGPMIFLVASIVLFSTRHAQSQADSINWSKIAGGGGTSSGGQYSMTGTVGQSDAGVPMSGGNYSVSGGFWAGVVPTSGPPLLGIQTTNNAVMVYWPSPSVGFSLQVNTNLATPNWVAPAESITDNGTIKYILVNPPSGSRFYRLKSP